MDEFIQSETGYTLGIDEAFRQVASATLAESRTNAQMLEALVSRVRSLRESGSALGEIRVVLPTEAACERFRAVAEAALACSRADLDVVTPRGLALAVLDEPAAQAAIGRRFPGGNVRVALPYEADFLFEDLKTLGMAPKRLREMLKFIYRGFTELADESSDWLVTNQERTVVEFLRAELTYLACAIEPELSNLATKALRQDAQLRASFARRHAVVGDYQDLSRASQLLCHLVATDSIYAVANERCAVEVGELYPHKAGIEEFFRVNADAQRVSLDDPQKAAVVREQAWADPNEEIRAIPGIVQGCVERGHDRVAVVCFHPQWRRNVRTALQAAGVAAERDGAPFLAKRDVRNFDASLSLRMVTALRLLADPSDSLARRCLLGFGDYLAKSNMVVPDRAEAQKERPDVTFAERWDAGAGPFSGLGAVRSMFARFAGLTGRDLLEALCQGLSGRADAAIPRDLAPLLEAGADATASRMIERIDRSYAVAISDGDSVSSAGVAVVAPEELAGRDFDAVVLTGFVNGLFPVRGYFDLTVKSLQQRERMLGRDREVVELIRCAASGEIVVSSFVAADLALAERLRLKVDRIRFKDGTRIACTSQSIHAKALLEGKPASAAACL